LNSTIFDGWIFDDLNKGYGALAPNLWKELLKISNASG
jgi:hypothetical protein